MGPHQGRAEGKENLPRPAAHTRPDAPQDPIGLLGTQGTLLAHAHPVVHQHTQVPLHSAALQQVHPSLYWCLGLFLPRCRTLPLPLLIFIRLLCAQLSSLSRSRWMAIFCILKYPRYFTVWIHLALKLFLIKWIFWNNFISALSYHFMPIFNFEVIFTFEFGISHTTYIFTSTCYLQSVSSHHYFNTFSPETLTWAFTAFFSYVLSSPSLQSRHSQNSTMCRTLLLATGKAAVLHSCYSLQHSLLSKSTSETFPGTYPKPTSKTHFFLKKTRRQCKWPPTSSLFIPLLFIYTVSSLAPCYFLHIKVTQNQFFLLALSRFSLPCLMFIK